MGSEGDRLFEKYRRNMGNAQTDIKNGVENTTKDQAKNAIKAKELMVENHRKAIENGKWEKNLKNAGHEKWKRNFLAKGVGKITAGIDANASEIKETMQMVHEVGQLVRSEVDKMPKGGIENSLARVRKMMETSQAAWGKD